MNVPDGYVGNPDPDKDPWGKICSEVLWSLSNADLTGVEFRIVLAILHETYTMTPTRKKVRKMVSVSSRKIAEFIGSDRRGVRRALARLQQKGVLTVENDGLKTSKVGFQKNWQKWNCGGPQARAARPPWEGRQTPMGRAARPPRGRAARPPHGGPLDPHSSPYREEKKRSLEGASEAHGELTISFPDINGKIVQMKIPGPVPPGWTHEAYLKDRAALHGPTYRRKQEQAVFRAKIARERADQKQQGDD